MENSFRHLSNSDLHAMAAYLRTVPPFRDPQQTERVVREVKPVDMSTLETGQGYQASLADASGTMAHGSTTRRAPVATVAMGRAPRMRSIRP
ncbi:hypothetical protein [Pseudomonas sp. L13]|uniref:hypothetical protein n=1 Tax=Pseudomonas sp. L13 TaxID=343985 RepID=UPI0021146740|nr:hypothetical protein [Pseudomonas sp. L13]